MAEEYTYKDGSCTITVTQEENYVTLDIHGEGPSPVCRIFSGSAEIPHSLGRKVISMLEAVFPEED